MIIRKKYFISISCVLFFGAWTSHAMAQNNSCGQEDSSCVGASGGYGSRPFDNYYRTGPSNIQGIGTTLITVTNTNNCISVNGSSWVSGTQSLYRTRQIGGGYLGIGGENSPLSPCGDNASACRIWVPTNFPYLWTGSDFVTCNGVTNQQSVSCNIPINNAWVSTNPSVTWDKVQMKHIACQNNQVSGEIGGIPLQSWRACDTAVCSPRKLP